MQFNVFPHDSKFDFMRLRWVSTGLSVLLLLLAFGAMATKGFNFALDFTGGVGVELRYDQAPDVDDVRESLAKAGYENAVVQTFGSGNDLLVRLQADKGSGNSAESVGDAVAKAASQPGNPAEKRSSAEISPQVGKELAQNGVYAMLFVVIGFLAYISFRFEWKFAVALILGILTSMYTAVSVSRGIATLIYGHRRKLKSVAI